MAEQRWSELVPEKLLVRALDVADQGLDYVTAEAKGSPDDKKNWSNRFADSSAAAVANLMRSALRDLKAPKDLDTFPKDGGTAEKRVLLGDKKQKRIDVAVLHQVGGLRIDISLKGLNFRDKTGRQFDKNVTGRTYEIEDELSHVRTLQPAAFVYALYLVPLEGAEDKVKGQSSFARTVLHLRGLVNRQLPGMPRPPNRFDGAAVGLYAPKDTPVGNEVVLRGALRCLDVMEEPPFRGRPQVSSTLSLGEVIRYWVQVYLDATGSALPSWAAPEDDL